MSLKCTFPTSREDVQRLRAKWIPRAQGLVAEIGFGEGSNVPFFDSGVRELMAIDRDIEMTDPLQNRLKILPFPVLLSRADAERIPVREGVFDCVVCTWTLCSVKSPSKALMEVKRVLKPGGIFLFLEHGFADRLPIQLFQDLWTPIQKVVADGCHINRQILFEIGAAGFQLDEFEQTYLRGFPPFSFVSAGIARKPAE